MKTEFLLINFHDNDFYLPMCKTAEFLLSECDDELSFPSTHIENYKNVIPKMMAIFQYMNAYHAGSDIHELEHYEKYFASHTDYITDLEDIKAHIEKYNMTTNGIPIENSGLYDDKLLKDDPVYWLHSLKLNLNSEAIFMLFTDNENGNSYNYIII